MKKVRQPKSAHRKTQTPIVAKQISSSGKDVSSHNNLPGPALLPNPQRYCARKKSIPFPARETYPATAYEICLASKLYHTFLSFTREFGKNVKKEPILSKDTWRYAKPARAHPPREKASRRAHPCGLPRERTPPAAQTARIASRRRRRSGERGADGPAAVPAAGPSAHKRRERRKRLSRLVCHVSFVVCIVRLPPIRGRDAGRRSFRHQEEFVDHPLGAIALLGLPQTL